MSVLYYPRNTLNYLVRKEHVINVPYLLRYASHGPPNRIWLMQRHWWSENSQNVTRSQKWVRHSPEWADCNNYGVTSTCTRASLLLSITPWAAVGSEAWQDESGSGSRCGESPQLNRWLCLQAHPGTQIICLERTELETSQLYFFNKTCTVRHLKASLIMPRKFGSTCCIEAQNHSCNSLFMQSPFDFTQMWKLTNVAPVHNFSVNTVFVCLQFMSGGCSTCCSWFVIHLHRRVSHHDDISQILAGVCCCINWLMQKGSRFKWHEQYCEEVFSPYGFLLFLLKVMKNIFILEKHWLYGSLNFKCVT